MKVKITNFQSKIFFKNIFVREIIKKKSNSKQDDYLLFPNERDRQQLYERIRKNFTRISSELGLYVRNGATRHYTQ